MRRGFSLIELSIVLVILGLLVGGILAGKSLIRAAEIRAVTAEYSRYITATHAFRDKYMALPGDIANASSFWGAQDGNDGVGADCRAESSGTPTCNGNNDGQICPGAACGSNTYESYLFWTHLVNAGLIEGKYSGTPATAPSNALCVSTGALLPGCNVPASKITSAGWFVNYIGTSSASAYLFDGGYGNAIALSTTSGFNTATAAAPLRAEEMWNIDTKMDDGQPAFGKVVVSRWNVCTSGAASVADGINAKYRLSDSDLRCMPVFRNVF